MQPQKKLLHKIPAWLLVVCLMFMGSGWTMGSWGGSNYGGNSIDIDQGNYGHGNYRDNWGSGSTSGSGCWGCYVPLPPCPPPPPPPCYSCPDPNPDPDPDPQPTGKCKGVKSMTLRYNGDSATTVEVSHKGDSLGTFNVAPGETFTVTGANDKKGKLHADVTLKWDGQEVKIHTSCSKPIDVGDVHGDFEITDLDKVYEEDKGKKDKKDKDDDKKDKKDKKSKKDKKYKYDW